MVLSFPWCLNCLRRALGVFFECWGCSASPQLSFGMSSQLNSALISTVSHSRTLSMPWWFMHCFSLLSSLIAALGKEESCIHEWELTGIGVMGHVNRAALVRPRGELFLQQGIVTSTGNLLPSTSQNHLCRIAGWLNIRLHVTPSSRLVFLQVLVGRKATLLSWPSYLQKWQQRTRPLVADDSTRQQRTSIFQ